MKDRSLEIGDNPRVGPGAVQRAIRHPRANALGPSAIAKRLGIGRATVYRALAPQ